MKILWLSHLVPYPPKGGVLQRSYNLIRETSKYHSVSLLAFIQPDLIESRFPSLETGLKEAHEHLGEFCDQVTFIDIPCESSHFGKHLLALKSLLTKNPYTINWLISDSMRSAITQANKKTKFDIIHFDTISLAPYVCQFTNIPKVLNHHNIESHMVIRRAQQEKSLLKHIYFYLEGKKLLNYEKKTCPLFDCHLTCSTVDSTRLSSISPSLLITEIPNGVDINYFQPQPVNTKEGHLIFAGSLSWYPNRDAMLYFANEIWPLLNKTSPEVTMNVVGSSPPAELLELAANDGNFIVHGYVDDVRQYISSAAVYICPIRDGGGTKLKILDAFSMGMATVAHPISCEGIDVEDGVNIFLASTPMEFASKINQLLADPELRRDMGLQARALVEKNYNFSQIGTKLSKQYLQLAGREQ